MSSYCNGLIEFLQYNHDISFATAKFGKILHLFEKYFFQKIVSWNGMTKFSNISMEPSKTLDMFGAYNFLVILSQLSLFRLFARLEFTITLEEWQNKILKHQYLL